MRSNQLSYPAMTYVKIVVEIEGLEPSLTEPESVVLPLHHISIWLPFLNLGLQRYECFVKMQNFFHFFIPFALNIRGIVEFVQQYCFGVFFAKD